MMTLFFRFDKTHSDDELLFLECFCNIADGIEVRFLTLQYAPPPPSFMTRLRYGT